MANPSIVACTKDTWNLVASGVTNGTIYNMTPTVKFMQTYRMATQAAPATNAEAVLAFNYPYEPLGISASAAIDVYLMPIDEAGSVRVDL